MAYRDDRDALKERIENLERTVGRAVSPEEVSALREELVEARGRIDGEREALDGLLARLDGKTHKPARSRHVAFGAVSAVVLAMAGVGVAFLVRRGAPEGELADYRGAPDAVRAMPVRREVDTEVAKRIADLDGCIPEGDNARILVTVFFEGRNGAVREIEIRNASQHDRYPHTTPDCLKGVFLGVGTGPFRSPRYQYQLTLEWAGGRLQRPPIWERHELVDPPPSQERDGLTGPSRQRRATEVIDPWVPSGASD